MEDACSILRPAEVPNSVGPPPGVQPCRALRGDVDAATLRAASGGDAAAIERFVRHYESSVFAFLARSLGRGPHIEDLAQEVFLRVLRALPHFEKREAKVSTWIFQIAVRLIQDQRKRPQRNFVAVTEELGDLSQNPEQRCASRRLLTRIELLVDALPPEQRMALVLIEFHGMSHAEVAQVMTVSPSTVKTRLHRARTFLRRELSEAREGRE